MNSGHWKWVLTVLLSAGIACHSAFAQTAYTLADTLRGSLRMERICYDVKHYDLRVRLDTAQKSITGFNTLSALAIENFREIQLDLYRNMLIDSLVFEGKSLSYNRLYDAVFVQFPREIKKGESFQLLAAFHGQPQQAKRAPWDGGFVWTYDEKGFAWVAVACEGDGASLWWPNKDHLSDEPDSVTIHCSTPVGMDCICNGQDLGVVSEASANTHSWKVTYPINNYNITLNAGRYAHFSDTMVYGDGSRLALNYYVIRENLGKAKKQFAQVKPMLECYDHYVGHYPFMRDGYKLVETPYLGMEHQSAIAYGNHYKTGYDGRDFSKMGMTFDYIIIHETGHEWWGNAVSCKDIADMWIHESFCTYMESLYVECLFGKDTAIRYINAKKSQVDNQANIVGVYGVNEEGDGDMYNKGSLFLNTLRYVAGDDAAWFAALKGFYEKYKYTTTDYNAVVSYFSAALYTDLSKVFEQYLRNPGIPELEYMLKKKKKNEYVLYCKWKTDVRDFNMPVDLIMPDGKHKRLEPSSEKSLSISLSKRKKEGISFDDQQAYFTFKAVNRL